MATDRPVAQTHSFYDTLYATLIHCIFDMDSIYKTLLISYESMNDNVVRNGERLLDYTNKTKQIWCGYFKS